MGTVNTFLRIGMSTKGFGVMIDPMVRGIWSMPRGRYIMVSIRMERCMGLGSINGLMARYTKVTGRIVVSMEMVSTNGMMVESASGTGRIIS